MADDHEIREITLDAVRTNSALEAALIQGEKVHELGKGVGREQHKDLHQRMALFSNSTATSRKRAFGLFKPGSDIPTHVVYAYMDTVAVTGEDIDPQNYPCNMHTILTSGNDTVNNPTIAVCYSISTVDETLSKEDKSTFNGTTLLGGVYDKLRKGGVKNIITLSPMPDFENWLKEKAQHSDDSFLDTASKEWLSAQAAEGSAIQELATMFEDEHYNQLTSDNLARFNDIISDVALVYLDSVVKLI